MYTFQAFSLLKKPRPGGRSVLVMSLLCLLLAFVQTTALEHRHDDRSLVQVDCDLCLKLGANDDALSVAAVELSFRAFTVRNTESARPIPFIAVPPAKSRAPPLA